MKTSNKAENRFLIKKKPLVGSMTMFLNVKVSTTFYD